MRKLGRVCVHVTGELRGDYPKAERGERGGGQVTSDIKCWKCRSFQTDRVLFFATIPRVHFNSRVRREKAPQILVFAHADGVEFCYVLIMQNVGLS